MTTPEVKTRKKLIEVALPLDAINAASAREKSIRHGHPSTLHLWWSRKPTATARVVLFAQLVDDPSEYVNELLDSPSLYARAQEEHTRQLALWMRRKAEPLSAGNSETTPVEQLGAQPTLEECLIDLERRRLFDLIEALALWQNSTNQELLSKAREEIHKSWLRACHDNADHPSAAELFNPANLPAFHDPFAGGGSLPLEAQRLGLTSYASDLNPIAVVINKATIEVPSKFSGLAPVNQNARTDGALFKDQWVGTAGLADDVRHYANWIRVEAEKRIGALYPNVLITREMSKERPDLKKYEGRELTVIAWIWARNVKSPNPAFDNIRVPLASTFMLSTKKGKEVYVEPTLRDGEYEYCIKLGRPSNEQTLRGTKAGGSHSSFLCLASGAPISFEYLRKEARAGRMHARLMAVVLEGDRERVYLSPTPEMEELAGSAQPEWRPEAEINHWPGRTNVVEYGLTTFGDLFTDRQLAALNTFSDLVHEVQDQVQQDALHAGMADDRKPLEEGGLGARAYAEAIAIYMGLIVNKCADYWSRVCTWHNSGEKLRNTFSRQAIPMTWEYAEANPFSNSTGNWTAMSDWTWKALSNFPATSHGSASIADAQSQVISKAKVISTDPPYYDNIGYADLADFFYVWMRRTLKAVLPSVFATLAVPKDEELVAVPHRHGGKEGAEDFFLKGMTLAMERLAELAHPCAPVTIYYAFKQAETRAAEGTASTGWETFLQAVIHAGFGITGTWPMRTELTNRMVGRGANALASSVVLVCRPHSTLAPIATRREFHNRLKAELPTALHRLQKSNIAPVDLAQAAIGPGMALYTSYSAVIDAQGNQLSVREALTLINRVLDEVLAEQEGDFDSNTRWALAWFEHKAYEAGEYGVADSLSKAKNTSVGGMVNAGFIKSTAGKVRLLRPDEFPAALMHSSEKPLTVWEALHYLVRAHEAEGEQAAAQIAVQLGALADIAQELAYRLFNICDRKGWAQEALSFNAFVQSWPEIQQLARQQSSRNNEAVSLF